jgi:hypothetical protein
MGSPEGWLGGFVPVRLVLARTAERVVILGPMAAFSTGVEMTLLHTSREPVRGPFMGPGGFGPAGDEMPLIGIAFSDGSKWQSGGQAHLPPSVDAPAAPYVQFQGGGGGGGTFRMELWLWPLPPEGPVTFAFAWPAHGIEETTIVVDAQVFRTAASQAEQLWEPLTPEERAALEDQFHQAMRPPPGTGFTTMPLRLHRPNEPPSNPADRSRHD